MKKLMLITLLSIAANTTWGAAQELPRFTEIPSNMAMALMHLEHILLAPYYDNKSLDTLTNTHLLNGLNAAIYAGQLDVAGIYAIILDCFSYDRRKKGFNDIKKRINLLPRYGVQDELYAKLIARYTAE